MYGTTVGGASGTVFELAANHTTFTNLVFFTGNSGNYPGASPQSRLTLDSNGNLYGTTIAGGIYGDGTLFEISSDHVNFTSLVAFTGSSGNYVGANPFAGVVIDSSGNIFGTTFAGGASSSGTVYELAANHLTFTSLLSFTGTSGAYPGANPYNLATDQAGNMFGVTGGGGLNGDGTVFKLASDHTTFNSLVNFSGVSGNALGMNPTFGLTIDSSGNLYGTTTKGGTNGFGSAFAVAVRNQNAFSSLFSFASGGGIAPYGSLAQDSSGNLFGVTVVGGVFDCGTIYGLSGPSYSVYTTLISFSGSSGSYLGKSPSAGLSIDGDGNLYGTTYTGGMTDNGTVFELAANHATFSTLISFTGTTGIFPGATPEAGITFDANGNMFGTTSAGGSNNAGTIFELAANHVTFSTLYAFTLISGTSAGPYSGITLDTSGNLYGTTANGGTSYRGSIFELSANHSTFSTLISFTGISGSYLGLEPDPYTGLTIDSNGNLYGASGMVNSNYYGNVFELSANHTTFISLINFTGVSGTTPGGGRIAKLTLDKAGNLYGVTSGDGELGNGSVFKLTADHSTYTSLVSFTGESGDYPGGYPRGPLLIDAVGNLFGTTGGGGAYGEGSVFKIPAAENPTHLVFSSGPTNFYTGSALNFPTGVQVSIEDDAGQVVYGNSDSITVSLSTTDAGATLSGKLTVQAVGGVATFTNLLFNTSGTGFKLGAIDNDNQSVPMIVSAPFSLGVNSFSIPANNTVTFLTTPSGTKMILTNTLTIAGTTDAWTGKLDLTNNVTDIITGSLTTIENQLKQGFNNGSWLGNGIVSSTAASAANHLTAVGVIQNNQGGSSIFNSVKLFNGTTPGPTDVLLKYTYYGDANLDGKVDASDYSRIDSGYLTHATSWYNGDFNYDGAINGSDYTLIDNAFNTQGAALADRVARDAVSLAASVAIPNRMVVAENDWLSADKKKHTRCYFEAEISFHG